MASVECFFCILVQRGRLSFNPRRCRFCLIAGSESCCKRVGCVVWLSVAVRSGRGQGLPRSAGLHIVGSGGVMDFLPSGISSGREKRTKAFWYACCLLPDCVGHRGRGRCVFQDPWNRYPSTILSWSARSSPPRPCGSTWAKCSVRPTWRQANIYRDVITFNSHILALNPAARFAHVNLAKGLFDRGRLGTEKWPGSIRGCRLAGFTAQSHGDG